MAARFCLRSFKNGEALSGPPATISRCSPGVRKSFITAKQKMLFFLSLTAKRDKYFIFN